MTDDLQARLAVLEARTRELEDVREINDLMRRFHLACTGGFNGVQTHRYAEFADLFADDGTIEVQYFHKPGEGPKGHQEIADYMKSFFGDDGPAPYVFQTGLDYGVNVDGDVATQESNMILIVKVPNAGRIGANSLVANEVPPDLEAIEFNRYVNHYKRTPQGWRIRRVSLMNAYRARVGEITPNSMRWDEYRALA